MIMITNEKAKLFAKEYVKNGFNGTEAFGAEFIELRNEIARDHSLISTLKNENVKLRSQYKVAVEQINALQGRSLRQ